MCLDLSTENKYSLIYKEMKGKRREKGRETEEGWGEEVGEKGRGGEKKKSRK